MTVALLERPIMGAIQSKSPPTPTPPAPDQSEIDNRNTQTDILKQQLAIAQQQQAYGNAIAPLQLIQSGYSPEAVADDYQAQPGETVVPIGGKQYRIARDPNEASLDAQNREISLASGARTLAALKGELPVDPAVEQDITRGRQELMEELRNRLGPGFETSDPGMRALSEYDRNTTAIRYQVRTGELNSANAIAMNTQGGMQRRSAQALASMQDVLTPIARANETYVGAGSLAGGMIGRDHGQRLMQMQLGNSNQMIGQQMDAQGNQSLISGGMGLAGGVGGALIL